MPVLAQNAQIKGTVKDAKGEAVIGASIFVKGTQTGTASDLDGSFSLQVPHGAVLEVSAIGYQGIELPVAGKTNIDIVLSEDTTLLDDVVVVGYATMRKKDVTGSVVQVKAGDRDNEAPGTVQDLLRNVPGMNIGANNTARGGGDIEIRGERSMSAITSSAPMLVLDGMPFYGTLAEINPEDIGQIDILKDASAAAVYGSQAANGVIIITTKKGKQGKPVISFSSKIGLVQMTRRPRMMNGEELLEFERDYQKRQTYGFSPSGEYGPYQSGRVDQPGYYDRWDDLPAGVSVDQWRAYSGADASMSNPEVWFRRIVPAASQTLVEGYLAGKTFDWDDYATRLGLNQDYTASISGASDRTNYYMSLSYLKNRGVLLGDEYNTFRANMKLTTKITDWLEVSANVAFSDRSDTDMTILFYNPRGGVSSNNVSQNNPFTSMYYADGTLNPHPNGETNSSKGYNYAYNQKYQNEESGTTTLNSILTAKLILPFDITYSFNVSPRFIWGYDRLFTSADHIDYTATQRGVNRDWNKTFEWNLNNTINWDHTFAGKHHFTVTLVQEAERHQTWMDFIRARKIEPTDALGFHFTSGAGKLESSFGTTDTYQSGVGYLARLFYSYDDRYMITASVRRDGYSAFGQAVPYATFPSVALAWSFTNEPWFKWTPMSMGKLRLSWGQNGNRALKDPYLALASLATGSAPFGYLDKSGALTEMQYLTLDRMANPNLKWERSESYNIALDFGFLKNRITGSIEAYHIITRDMILNRTLPNFTGFSEIAANIGQVSNRGFEISVSSRNMDRPNFKWNTTFNLSYNRNRIDHLYYEYDENGKELDDIASQWFIGKPISVIWNYDVQGIYQVSEAAEAKKLGLVPGDVKVRNVYTENDRILEDGTRVPVYDNNDKVFLGDSQAPVLWSLYNNFTFLKNFDFSFNLASQMGAKFIDTMYSVYAEDVTLENGLNFVNRPYWRPDRPYNDWGRINAQMPAGASGGLLHDRSFIRLENVSLAYNVPKSFISRFGISSLRLNATVRNAGVISLDGWKYYDPQTLSFMNRTITFGVNVTL
ncbi:MAG: SusC/RagA family TonB-linked outer membrane protein [Bacteroidales bacterium]|nr:SusC/RagA family TonB-linked outer membrane protein [Bacteroidales bacterium]MBR1578048.1 SusC/RagA family TonB-linked outer membrane protein [Bacteroidales bacterium]